jgi:3-deoxy-manno-octulosonate cytidylyltransferase (CMP-KDO synthetase)
LNESEKSFKGSFEKTKKGHSFRKMKKVLALIPARFSSTRLPGKPLADLGGKTIVERVYRQVSNCPDVHEAVVATDDERIRNCVIGFGGKVVMTSENCLTGTDRCAEALALLDSDADLILNVQGDEPFIQPEQISQLVGCMEPEQAQIGTLVKRIRHEADLMNPNVVKAVLTSAGKALYFSRSCIPYVRDAAAESWLSKVAFYRHIGIYAFRKGILPQLSLLPAGALEKAESLEQLRWLEAGFSLFAAETELESMGIDSPEDLEKARNLLNMDK